MSEAKNPNPNSSEEDSEKGENPDPAKVAAKRREEQGKTFAGKGTEKRG